MASFGENQEGGNVSAHATHLVGSALSDPFLSYYSTRLLSLTGPLHGLTAQEVLRWILAMQDNIGTKFTDKDVRIYLWDTLNSGRLVPGYGHSVLRKPDPHFGALTDFADTRPDVLANLVFQLVKKNSEIAPGVLMEHGKMKNPHPLLLPLVCSYITMGSISCYTTRLPSVSVMHQVCWLSLELCFGSVY